MTSSGVRSLSLLSRLLCVATLATLSGCSGDSSGSSTDDSVRFNPCFFDCQGAHDDSFSFDEGVGPEGRQPIGQPESCNGLDDDLDGVTDEDGSKGCEVFLADNDQDGCGNDQQSSCVCVPHLPYTALKGGDCDDNDSARNPLAEEVCYNDIDEDCDGASLPDCTGKVCGQDGCGSLCGACNLGEVCNNGGCYAEDCLGDCTGKECGNDGCGNSCGDCPLGQTCSGNTCLACAPTCSGKDCGPDGCGGSCGVCSEEHECVAGVCKPQGCTPQCAGKGCGDDGCGGSCGTCPAGQTCEAGICTSGPCTPQCTGKVCGDDGCGGSCGQCAAGTQCQAGACVPVCTPQCAGKVCGDNGCGGTCGSCPSGQSCVAGKCQVGDCVPNCDGKTCGDDGCGGACSGGVGTGLPAGRALFTVALARLNPGGTSWARLAQYTFKSSGEVSQTFWLWSYLNETGKTEVTTTIAPCDKDKCKVYGATRFPSGGGYPKVLTGKWTVKDAKLAIDWSDGASESWKVTDLCDRVRLDLAGSDYNVTNAIGYGSNAALETGLGITERMASPSVTLHGPYAQLAGDKVTSGEMSLEFPGDWKGCTDDVAVRFAPSESCGSCPNGEATSPVRYYLAWLDGRKDAFEHFCECLLTSGKCYNGNARLKSFLQVLGDTGTFHGWVGVEASLYTGGAHTLGWVRLTED